MMGAASLPLDMEAESVQQSMFRSHSVGFLAGSTAAFTSWRTSESSGEYVDDSGISNKVRGQLLGDKDLNITQSIETYEGVVQLSGFVDTPEAKNPTGAVAASVSVKQVRNNLVAK